MQALVKEITGIAGLGLLTFGLWHVDWRLSCCTLGVLLLAGAVYGVTR
jgi:hypothetical protein